MYNYSIVIKDSTHAPPTYIKRSHNKIDHETLLWDNFMYSACLTTMNAVLGSTHLHKKAPYKIDHETLLWDNFMYSALFYTLCRSALFLAPPT